MHTNVCYSENSRTHQDEIKLRRHKEGQKSLFFLTWTARSYHFSKFTLALRPLPYSPWNRSVLRGCKWSSCVTNRAEDAEISACWANQTNYFAGEVSNLTPIPSSFPAESTCSLRVFFLFRIEPVDRNTFTYLKIPFAFETCASGKFRLNLLQHQQP